MMGKMLPLQSGQKVDNAIPKAIYIIKNYFFTMIVQRSGRHYIEKPHPVYPLLPAKAITTSDSFNIHIFYGHSNYL